MSRGAVLSAIKVFNNEYNPCNPYIKGSRTGNWRACAREAPVSEGMANENVISPCKDESLRLNEKGLKL